MATGLSNIDATTASYDIANGKLDLTCPFPEQIATLILVNSKPKEVLKMPIIGGMSNTTLRVVKVDESCRHVTSIGDFFLYGCRGMTALDLSALSEVTNIGSCFLYQCSGIPTVDLAPLSNVTSIGDGFLYQCSGIAALDLGPLSNVTSIGGGFLFQCSTITTLDLTPLTQVQLVSRDGAGRLPKLMEAQAHECSSPMLLKMIPDEVTIVVVSDILV